MAALLASILRGQHLPTLHYCLSILTCSRPRLNLFRQGIASVFANQYADTEVVQLVELLPVINEGVAAMGQPLFSSAEAAAACEEMTKADEIMFSDGAVYRI
jgi:DNA replication licensing factor MCM3